MQFFGLVSFQSLFLGYHGFLCTFCICCKDLQSINDTLSCFTSKIYKSEDTDEYILPYDTDCQINTQIQLCLLQMSFFWQLIDVLTMYYN